MTTAPGRARRLAVLGSPISHSMSPRLHRAAYDVLGLDWNYEAVEIAGGGLGEFVSTRTRDWLGLSLTMPLKHDIRPFLSQHDELSMLTGSTNTVLLTIEEGVPARLGFNTDVGGIVRALAARGVTSAHDVVILGGGATAASALVAAAQLGAAHASVIVRTPQRAEPLREIAHRSGLDLTIAPLTTASLDDAAGSLTLSTLPGGAAPVDVVGGSSLPGRSALLDVAYHPWPSPLAALWNAEGRPAISGIDMLVHQALLQIRIFVGHDPSIPLADERRVLAAMFASVAETEPAPGTSTGIS
ncbi:shikimate dehydrogenase [Agreia sp. COWG]|uniref:shikimate dehydrogenase family protein n=1 Tax=Agreia sp. COWG TaxID=2773266 RepID=UPI0019264B77|nr:shikimate dehydrogenase [Agreia sp. COWG]CAD5998493.1 Shikimate 5-dehydrogenase I alpha [Agreia sp. COWG]